MAAMPPTASALLDLSEDMLTAVLLGLPAPRRREWVFIALSCRALHAAVLRASVEDTIDEQIAAGLPSGRNGAPASVFHPTGHRFATSIAGMMMTPLRIVYSKECLTATHPERGPGVRGIFDASVLPRARCQFLRVLAQHFSLFAQQSIERAARARARAEGLAAYRLTTRALYHVIALAPLHTIRSAFFDVLGGGPQCALDLSLRHHRCLVFFAAAHGRVDVLNRLVHRDPNRALAYDYDQGLLPLCWQVEDVRSMWRHSTMDSHLQTDRDRDIHHLVARPAALHNQVRVLEWLCATQLALRRRATGTRSRSVLRSPLLSTIEVGGLVLSLHASGVSADGTRVYGPDNAMAMGSDRTFNWRSLRMLVCEAAAGASLDVLDLLWSQIVGRGANGLPQLDDGLTALVAQDVAMRAALSWAVLLTLLVKPRRGDVVKWVVRRCYEDRDWLRAMAIRFATGGSPSGPHTWNPGTFDLEDLLHVALGTETRLIDYVMGMFDVRGEERLLRERVVGPGDAVKTDWLLDELEHTEALLSCLPYDDLVPTELMDLMLTLPSNTDTYVPETGRGWLSRSMVGYMREDGGVEGGGFFLRSQLDPSRWSRADSLCRHLLRLSHHMTGVQSASAPLFYETAESASVTFAKRMGPPEYAELPESLVFASPNSTANSWVPEHGLLGFTRLQQGVAAVLRRWIMHVLDRERLVGSEAMLHDRFEDWTRVLTEMPEACYASLVHVCERLLSGGDDADETNNTIDQCTTQNARRDVLGNLVTHVITSLGSVEADVRWSMTSLRADNPRLRCRYSWAIAYAEMASEWGLVPVESQNAGLIFTCTARTPTLHAAMQRALCRDTHATGNLPLHKTNDSSHTTPC